MRALFLALSSILVASRPLLAQAAPATTWQYVESKSAMDDSVQHYVVVDAQEEMLGTNNSVSRARLSLSCDGKDKRVVFLATGLVLQNGSIRLRFDKDFPDSQVWFMEGSRTALFRSDRKRDFFRMGSTVAGADKLVKVIEMHKQMLLEVHPYAQAQQLLTFNVEGLTEVLAAHGCPAR